MTEAAEKQQNDNSQIIEFLNKLTTYVKADIAKSQVRTTLDGIFIKSEFLHELFDAYREHISKLTGHPHEKDDSKIIKKIFQTETPDEVYLIEGKNTYIGVVIPIISRINAIPHFPGKTLAAGSFLHPRDPILTSISDMRTDTGKEGLEFIVKGFDTEINFSLKQLQYFQEISTSKIVLRYFPNAKHSLRKALPAFVEILKRSRPYKNQRPLFLPQRYQNNKQIKIYTWKNLVFIVSKNMLMDILASRGKLLISSIMEEANNQNMLRKVNKFIPFKDSRNVGAFDLVARNFELSKGALCDFIELSSLMKSEQNNKVFSVVGSLSLIAKLLETADTVPFEKLPPVLKPRVNSTIMCYEKQDWVFMVLKKKTILSILHRKIVKGR